MARIRYRQIKLSQKNRVMLDTINDIIYEYQNQGYVLTLRQLYYQLVSRDIIPNVKTEYAKLSTLLKEGRMAGVVDWEAIEDRLRKPHKPASFSSPTSIIHAAINQYQKDRQEGQKNYLEVWVEKDALSGVLRRVTEKYHVPILVNRGYSSVSAMHDSFHRFDKAFNNSQKVTILYLGDYDPSGLDMVRDIEARIREFIHGNCIFQDGIDPVYCSFEVIPLALTKEQIDLYNPPPNPAKKTDPRSKKFIEEFGSTSWEVDALKPEILHELLDDAIYSKLDTDRYDEILEEEKADKKRLKKLLDYL